MNWIIFEEYSDNFSLFIDMKGDIRIDIFSYDEISQSDIGRSIESFSFFDISEDGS